MNSQRCVVGREEFGGKQPKKIEGKHSIYIALYSNCYIYGGTPTHIGQETPQPRKWEDGKARRSG